MLSEAIDYGKIVTEKLSEIVFRDKEKLKLLNSITHPGTVEEIEKRIRMSKVYYRRGICITYGVRTRKAL